MLKTLFGIYWILFAIFIAFKNMHVFKIFIFDFKNVHPILDFLTRRGKFISYFSDFYLFFYVIFSAEFLLKKIRPRADWAKGPADGPAPPPRRLRPGDGIAARVPAGYAAARCPLPQATPDPPYLYRPPPSLSSQSAAAAARRPRCASKSVPVFLFF